MCVNCESLNSLDTIYLIQQRLEHAPQSCALASGYQSLLSARYISPARNRQVVHVINDDTFLNIALPLFSLLEASVFSGQNPTPTTTIDDVVGRSKPTTACTPIEPSNRMRWSIELDGKDERTRNDWLTQQLVGFIHFLRKNTYHSPQTYGEEMVGWILDPGRQAAPTLIHLGGLD
jgi:hypothetical protein